MAGMAQESLKMAAFSFNRVEIDLGALKNNFHRIQRTAGQQVRVMAVVKSDAYGHGLVECARALSDAGAETFGVAEVEEGVALRRAGLAGEIVILLGAAPESYEEVVSYDLTPVVYDLDAIAGLSAAASKKNGKVRVHLKVDVGMGRLGVAPAEVMSCVSLLKRLPSISLRGILSHLPSADAAEKPEITRAHLSRFSEVLARLKTGEPGVVHIANSAALIYFPGSRLDMVRPGISLYGCYPDALPARAQSAAPGLELQPVMRFATRVIQVKELEKGSGISYGHTYVTRRKSRIAVLPVGYADGYLRKLSNRAEVLIGGRRAPVRGRVCMNATMVEVTDLPPVHAGDEAVLLGRQGDAAISADEVAGWMETISYEVLCLLGSCNDRVYLHPEMKR